MKKILMATALLIFTSAVNNRLTAQEKLSEGKVVYEISFPDMELDPQTAGMMPSESVMYFKGAMSRTEMSMGMGISTATIMNSKTNEITSLTDMMGTKTATIIENDDKKSKGESLQFELVDETKEIAGFPCKKAIMKYANGSTLEMFYTENILSRSQFSNQWKDFKGFPMEYSVDVGGMSMKMTAKSILKEKVSDDLFKIPSDYKVMTQEEYLKMMGDGKE